MNESKVAIRCGEHAFTRFQKLLPQQDRLLPKIYQTTDDQYIIYWDNIYYLTFWKIENAYGMEDPSGEYYVHYAIAIQLNGRYIEKEDMNYIFPRFN